MDSMSPSGNLITDIQISDWDHWFSNFKNDIWAQMIPVVGKHIPVLSPCMVCGAMTDWWECERCDAKSCAAVDSLQQDSE